MATFGYARVSTTGQTLEAQIEILTAAGVDRIYQEKISAKDRERPQLKKLLFAIRPGDTVIVTKLDRLARSLRDLLNIIHEIGDAGAMFKSLGDPLFDTSSATGALVSQILAAVAEFERKLIKQRTDDGKQRARAAGVRFGRPRKMTQEQRRQALERLAAGETLEQIAATYGVHFSTISRLQLQKLSLDAAIAAHSNGGITRGY
jgi:DNA invertase Pin-like site-specific DNA recombinase